GVSAEAILLAWLLRHPAGIQPVIGTTRPERLVAACAADAVEHSREEWYALFTAARGGPVPCGRGFGIRGYPILPPPLQRGQSGTVAPPDSHRLLEGSFPRQSRCPV